MSSSPRAVLGDHEIQADHSVAEVLLNLNLSSPTSRWILDCHILVLDNRENIGKSDFIRVAWSRRQTVIVTEEPDSAKVLDAKGVSRILVEISMNLDHRICFESSEIST